MAVFTFTAVGRDWANIDLLSVRNYFVDTVFDSKRETFSSSAIRLFYDDATITFGGRGFAGVFIGGELADVTAGTLTSLFVDLPGGQRPISMTGGAVNGCASLTCWRPEIRPEASTCCLPEMTA